MPDDLVLWRARELNPDLTRRRAAACLTMGAVLAAAPLLSNAQTAANAAAPAPAQGYGRRRRRDASTVLWVGGMLAAIMAWIYFGGKRARKKELAKQDMERRLASARERSRNL